MIDPAKEEWTPAMLAVEELANRPVFRSADVMEFADIQKDAFQSWFKRGLSKEPRDPGISGPGNKREFTLREVATITMARRLGQRAFRLTLEASLVLGGNLTQACFLRWVRHARDFEKAGLSAEIDPLAVLKSLMVFLQSGSFDSVEFMVDGRSATRLASPDCKLYEVLQQMNSPYFTVIDMRMPMVEYFFPIAVRLFQRVADENNPVVRELEAMFAK